MRRLPLLALLAAALAAGCVHEAPGACADDAGCRAGEHCAGGVCLRDGQVALGGACELPAECASWATCAAGRCALRPGACEAEPHCAAWQDCGAAHACVLAPGMCDGEGDCAAWRSCLAHGCVLDAGRCERHGDCAAWQYCDGGHTCQDVGATCAGDGDCQAWQTCSTGHCANRPGACGASEQCEAWQVCDAANACVTAQGFCGTSLDCAAWQTCAPDHVCTEGYTCATDADCLSGEPCVLASVGAGTIGQCTAPFSYVSQGITIWGTLSEGACYRDALAPLHAPTRARVGFGCYDEHGWVEPGGSVLYLRSVGGERRLTRFVPDPWEYDETWDEWEYPSAPGDNDVEIPTPACATDVWQVVLQAGTGSILYSCGDGRRWFDTTGNLVVDGYNLYAWNASGLKLVSDGSGRFRLLDAANVLLPATTDLAAGDLIHARAHGEGFHVARYTGYDYSSYGYERWYVGPDGTAVLDGAYGDRPPGYQLYGSVLDSAGRLYFEGYRSDTSAGIADVVVRCDLAPGTCEIVYDEADAPEIRYDVYPPRVFVFMHISYLITGP